MEQLAAVAGRDVSRETIELLNRYVELLRGEAAKQNLISASTMGSLWQRHILDSAQLVRFEPERGASWVDIGSGAGLPGIVVAVLVEGPVTLVEPRRLRADFLQRVIESLGLGERARVATARVETVTGSYDVITARAVAKLEQLLKISTHLSTRKSRWVLPKGRSGESELAEARRNWHCEAEIVPSLTDADSRILLLRDVKARGGQ